MENNKSAVPTDKDPFTIYGPCKSCTKDVPNAELIPLLIKGVNFAAIKHKDQRRKNPEKTPYINHPIGL